MRTLLSIVGARPQFIKAAALDRAFAATAGLRHSLLHTGQHYDDRMSRVFFEELGLPRPYRDLGAGSAAHGQQTARMLEGIEAELLDKRPDAVILYGDTNSTLAGALAAAKLRIPIAHVEAGLRSFNKAMPEEINRVVCDHCATWLFCPTETAMRNLEREGFGRPPLNAQPSANHPSVLMTGDVMLDSALRFAALAAERSSALRNLDVKENGYLLATVHRDFNTDDRTRLGAIIEALHGCAAEHGIPVLWPVHPRAQLRIDELRLSGLRWDERCLRLLPPAGYLDMIELERRAALVITDSGGVQKEAYFFHKPCVVLRPSTEWIELVEHGQAELTDAEPARIQQAVSRFLAHGAPPCPPLYGDGHAAERMAEALA